MLSVKQGGIKYHFLSLWYNSTWCWTPVSRAIGEPYEKELKNFFGKKEREPRQLSIKLIYVLKGIFGILEICLHLKSFEFFKLLIPFDNFWVNASVDSSNRHHVNKIDVIAIIWIKDTWCLP